MADFNKLAQDLVTDKSFHNPCPYGNDTCPKCLSNTDEKIPCPTCGRTTDYSKGEIGVCSNFHHFYSDPKYNNEKPNDTLASESNTLDEKIDKFIELFRSDIMTVFYA